MTLTSNGKTFFGSQVAFVFHCITNVGRNCLSCFFTYVMTRANNVEGISCIVFASVCLLSLCVCSRYLTCFVEVLEC